MVLTSPRGVVKVNIPLRLIMGSCYVFYYPWSRKPSLTLSYCFIYPLVDLISLSVELRIEPTEVGYRNIQFYASFGCLGLAEKSRVTMRCDQENATCLLKTITKVEIPSNASRCLDMPSLSAGILNR